MCVCLYVSMLVLYVCLYVSYVCLYVICLYVCMYACKYVCFMNCTQFPDDDFLVRNVRTFSLLLIFYLF